VFRFVTGRLRCVIDESAEAAAELQRGDAPAARLDAIDFGRRLAAERELAGDPAAPAPNAVFDDSGNFLLYATLLGIKARKRATLPGSLAARWYSTVEMRVVINGITCPGWCGAPRGALWPAPRLCQLKALRGVALCRAAPACTRASCALRARPPAAGTGSASVQQRREAADRGASLDASHNGARMLCTAQHPWPLRVVRAVVSRLTAALARASHVLHGRAGRRPTRSAAAGRAAGAERTGARTGGQPGGV